MRHVPTLQLTSLALAGEPTQDNTLHPRALAPTVDWAVQPTQPPSDTQLSSAASAMVHAAHPTEGSCECMAVDTHGPGVPTPTCTASTCTTPTTHSIPPAKTGRCVACCRCGRAATIHLALTTPSHGTNMSRCTRGRLQCQWQAMQQVTHIIWYHHRPSTPGQGLWFHGNLLLGFRVACGLEQQSCHL